MDRASATTRSGFTLLEILVAATLTALLAAALYATLYTSFKARKTAEQAVAKFRRAELAASFVCSELREAVVPNGILAGSFTGTDNGDYDTVDFYRTADATDQDICQDDIMMVELACETSSDGTGMNLLRKVRRNLLAPIQYDLPGEVICRNVLAFNLKYFDGTDWLDDWSSSQENNSLPMAIEVNLALADDQSPADGSAGAPAVLQATHRIWMPLSTLKIGTQVGLP